MTRLCASMCCLSKQADPSRIAALVASRGSNLYASLKIFVWTHNLMRFVSSLERKHN
jgi:hypothetical protein